VLNYVTLTAEPGVIGGLPQSGLDFGAAVNTDAVIHQNQQFDFYDGGGLDMACLGMAQVDADGHVNVSRFGPRLAGAGGFINISQSSRRVLFAGTFTTGGLEVKVENGELKILREGKSRKFVQEVEQITFNGAYAAESGQAGAVRDRALRVPSRARGDGVDRGSAGNRCRPRYPGPDGFHAHRTQPGHDGPANLSRPADGARRNIAGDRHLRAREL
jgi:hypothetical protein